jgi:hypothetical protein
MNIEVINDKYRIWCGKIPRNEIDQRLQWCVDSWGDNWGFFDTVFGDTCFVFYRLAHANWFNLRYS